jgi:sialic acid synthase SpsE
MGDFGRLKEAVDLTKELELDALKLQLFPDEHPYVPTNVYLPPKLFTEAFKYASDRGVTLSASVFDSDSFEFLLDHNPAFIKFSYSRRNEQPWIEATLNRGIEAIVSCDVMTEHLVPADATKLYCIPEYPVRYEVCFDQLFPRFAGFSDHTLGMRQTARAVCAGAQLIEKHIRLGYENETCPDAFFAVNIRELAKIRDLAGSLSTF